VAALIVAGAACSTTTAGSGLEQTPPSAGSSSHDFPSGPISPLPAPSTSVARSPASTTPALPPNPSPAQLAARLANLVHGQQFVLVAVPGGYEAISYDQQAHVGFWRYTSTDWTRVATSTYPYSSAIGGPAEAKAIGTLLNNMHDATFIVTGNFTGDSSGNAVAYTTGSRGWGAIKAEPNGNIGPSGQPVGNDQIGLSYGFAFVGGNLQTKDCPASQPIANCGVNPVVKLWAWNGTDFSRI
jgi:hypothetical protein